MRMRGLEPPPSYLDTDLNRRPAEDICPPGPERPILNGSAAISNASAGVTVAKLLSRQLLVIFRRGVPVLAWLELRNCLQCAPHAARAGQTPVGR